MGFCKETISKERAEEEAACEVDVSVAPKAAFVENPQTIVFRACMGLSENTILI